MPDTATLARRDGVELIRTGRWDISTGQWTASRDDLTAAVAAMSCPAIQKPIVKIGHTDKRFTPGDGEPAIGWFENLRTTDGGHTLVADQVSPAWLTDVQAAAWPNRSVEGSYNYRCGLGHTHPFVLTAVALLGVTPPGVSTLKPLNSLDDVKGLYGLAASVTPDDGGVRIVARFNPRQPRDDDGQWTDGPGGGGTPTSKFPGMKPATPADREAFRKATGKAIPPAWTDVHIADDITTAKLVVRGRDTKGRPQFIYSAAHTEGQAALKFARVKELTKFLDKLDHAIERDANTNDHAAALLLIRRLGMRPGSEKDTGADKKAHGATNLRARHVTVGDDGRTSFDFIGKKGVRIRLSTDDPAIAEAVRERLKTRSGDDRLFDTSEAKTRDYMRSTGVPGGFFLKDLRTLRANVIALREVKARKGAPQSKPEFQRWRREVADTVSQQLGNTPTLALASYINPTVFSEWIGDPSWV